MTTDALLKDLRDHQSLVLYNVQQATADYNRQFHPDLSPLGWHLGHCVFTEIYWLRERILEETGQNRALKALYVPELMPKQSRAAVLPDFNSLCRWAEQTWIEDLELLQELLASGHRNPLLENRFLLYFLIQHYAQHYETTMYILAQRCQQMNGEALPFHMEGTLPDTDAVTVPKGDYEIGTGDNGQVYDNELPVFTTHLNAFAIAKRPVCNGEYLRFMEEDGYNRPEFWPEEGWRWRTEHGITRPDHWRRNNTNDFSMIDETGPRPLQLEEPVHGISHYEARAFAAWAGGRLPHEYEWETAKKNGALIDDGRVWEWCANPFHPYEGFTAFPYDGYSVPYFDGRHYTLRGGSDYTRPCICRPGFRNYYEADKRHIRAGLRLVYDD